LQKLEVRDRTQAAVLAIQKGLVAAELLAKWSDRFPDRNACNKSKYWKSFSVGDKAPVNWFGGIPHPSVSKTPSGKYLASILTEVEGDNPATTEGKIYGIDLGLKHFAVVTDGEKVSKYDNPKHLAKHEKNLKRKQKS
jgi:transposase